MNDLIFSVLIIDTICFNARHNGDTAGGPSWLTQPPTTITQHLLLEVYLYNSNFIRHLATFHTKPLFNNIANKVNNIENVKQKNHT